MYRMRCCRCGKIECKVNPVDEQKRCFCPICGNEGRTAKKATWNQRNTLKSAYAPVDPPNDLIESIRKLGIRVNRVDETIQDHLKVLALKREDINDDHLVSHTHILGRPGFAAGNFKSPIALKNANTKGIEKPSFAINPKSGSPAQLGKLIEKELARRSELASGLIDVRSIQMTYIHPILDVPVNCEIDGLVEEIDPLEIMSVEDLDQVSLVKITEKLHQIAEEIICCESERAFLLLVERGILRRITIMDISEIVIWHLDSIERWQGVV